MSLGVTPTESPTHIHFGAGSFGLGMVVPLCKTAGFRTRVLCRKSNRDHHAVIQSHGGYSVQYDNDRTKTEFIEIVPRYFTEQDHSEIVTLLSDPAVLLVTTSVRPDNLQAIAPLIGRAVSLRKANNAPPLCVMACENLRTNSKRFQQSVEELLSTEDSSHFHQSVLFCNTVVDRICSPILITDDVATVPIETYHQWIVERPHRHTQAIEMLEAAGVITLAENNLEFKAYETQKYWCLNGTHLAAAAYAFIHPGDFRFLAEALSVPDIRDKVEALQREMETALLIYVDRYGLIKQFPAAAIRKYSTKVLQRLRKNRVDTIGRILKQADVSPELVVLQLIDSVAKANAASAKGSPVGDDSSTLLTTVREQLPGAIWLLDLHEVLERVTERFIEPLSEILAYQKELIDPRPETIPFHKDRKPTQRLQLDDALQAVVVATTKYARDQYSGIRKALLRLR